MTVWKHNTWSQHHLEPPVKRWHIVTHRPRSPWHCARSMLLSCSRSPFNLPGARRRMTFGHSFFHLLGAQRRIYISGHSRSGVIVSPNTIWSDEEPIVIPSHLHQCRTKQISSGPQLLHHLCIQTEHPTNIVLVYRAKTGGITFVLFVLQPIKNHFVAILTFECTELACTIMAQHAHLTHVQYTLHCHFFICCTLANVKTAEWYENTQNKTAVCNSTHAKCNQECQ